MSKQPRLNLDDLLITETPSTTGNPEADQWLGANVWSLPPYRAQAFGRAWEHALEHYPETAARDAFLGAALSALHGTITAAKAHASERHAARTHERARAARNGAFLALIEAGDSTAQKIAEETGLTPPAIGHALKRTKQSRERS